MTIEYDDKGKFYTDVISKSALPTGIRPLFGPRLEAAGFKLSPEVFGASVADILASNRQRR